MQQQFEPLSRSVRDLGDGLATFDRAVLASLRADTRDNRAAVADSAERLSRAANKTLDVSTATDASPVEPLVQAGKSTLAAGATVPPVTDQPVAVRATATRA
jgi:hypothetical protein